MITLPTDMLPLRKHPPGFRSTIERGWLFTYRTPEETVLPLLPQGITAVTRQGFAYWNIALYKIAGVRLAGLHVPLKTPHYQIAYRILTRDRSCNPGLHTLRCDVDNPFVTAAGNLLTALPFHTTPVEVFQESDARTSIHVHSKDASATVLIDCAKRPELAWNSPFTTIPEAAATLNPPQQCNLTSQRESRPHWRCIPVATPYASWDFLRPYGAQPEIAFETEPVAPREKQDPTCKPAHQPAPKRHFAPLHSPTHP